MKMNKFAMALVMGLAVAACAPKGEAVAEGEEAPAKEARAKDFLPSKANKDSVSYLIGINFGSFIKGYNFGDDLNYSEIVKGMKDFVKAKGNFRDPDFGKQFKVNPDEMNDLFNEYLANRQNYTRLMNKEKGEKFLAANKKKAGVQETESGLQYRIIEAGNDVKPSAQDTVWVRYKGTLLDGSTFDEVPAEADSVRMMLNRVVAGWTEGLQLIGEGGKIELFIPAELAYGEGGNQGIEPNSTLIFTVDLTKVGKLAVEEVAE